jgi:cbb3-type cytochrome oxidase subunit 3
MQEARTVKKTRIMFGVMLTLVLSLFFIGIWVITK